MKRFLLGAIALLLTACSSSAGDAVKGYLEAAASNNASLQQEFRCLKDAHPESFGELSGVQRWEITGQQAKVEENDPDGKYTLVTAKIESMGTSGFSVNRTWEFEVWNPDALFEHQKRRAETLNQVLAESQRVIEEAQRITGVLPTESSNELISPNRDNITNRPQCITSARPVS